MDVRRQCNAKTPPSKALVEAPARELNINQTFWKTRGGKGGETWRRSDTAIWCAGLPGPKPEPPAHQTCDNQRYLKNHCPNQETNAAEAISARASARSSGRASVATSHKR
jgi:hypothetical protein